jgi:hypothetical protein
MAQDIIARGMASNSKQSADLANRRIDSLPGGDAEILSVNGQTSVVVLDKTDIGLSNIDDLVVTKTILSEDK